MALMKVSIFPKKPVCVVFCFTDVIFGKEKFLKGLNDVLFKGNIRDRVDAKELDKLIDLMKKSNVDEESRQLIVNGINNA